MVWARKTGTPVLGVIIRYLANILPLEHQRRYVLTTGEALLVIDAANALAITLCACRDLQHNCDNPTAGTILVCSAILSYFVVPRKIRLPRKELAKVK